MLIDDYTSLTTEEQNDLDSSYRLGYSSGRTNTGDVLSHLQKMTDAAFRTGSRNALSLLAEWAIPDSSTTESCFMEKTVIANALFCVLHTGFWNSALNVFERSVQTKSGWDSLKYLLGGGCIIGYFHFARFDVPEELNAALQGKKPWVPEDDIKKMCIKFIKDFIENRAVQQQGGWEELELNARQELQHSIFLSYKRRVDSAIAGRILEELTRHFPDSSIFVDVVSIDAGEDFRDVIRSTLNKTDVVVAIIGREWIPVSKWIQFELETALALGIPIIPIVVGAAKMPAADDLPIEIKDVAYKNALSLDELRGFRPNMQELIDRLKRMGGRTKR